MFARESTAASSDRHPPASRDARGRRTSDVGRRGDAARRGGETGEETRPRVLHAESSS